MSIVKLNVGGYPCQVLSSTLEKSEFFKILLARPEMQTLTNEGDIFIDEDPDDFKIILKLLRGYIYTETLNDNIVRLIDYYQISTPLPSSEPIRLVMDTNNIYSTGSSFGQRSHIMRILLPPDFESFHIIIHPNDHGYQINLVSIEIDETEYSYSEYNILFRQHSRDKQIIYEAKKICLQLLKNCYQFGFSTNGDTTCTVVWTKYV